MIITAIVQLVITNLSIYLSIYCLKIEIVDNSFAVRFLLCEGHLGGLFLGAAAATPSTMVLFFDRSILFLWWCYRR